MKVPTVITDKNLLAFLHFTPIHYILTEWSLFWYPTISHCCYFTCVIFSSSHQPCSQKQIWQDHILQVLWPRNQFEGKKRLASWTIPTFFTLKSSTLMPHATHLLQVQVTGKAVSKKQQSISKISTTTGTVIYGNELTFKVLLWRWSSRQRDSSLLRAKMALLCSLCKWTFSFTTCACFFCSIFICFWTFRLSSN